MVRTFLLVVAFASFLAPAGAADAARPPRVRVRTPALESLFRTALDSSPTFHALVRELEESDLIVYVDRDLMLRPSVRGGITFAGAGEGVRYLNVWLNPRNSTQQMMATLGHELQHAVEVARAPHVRSSETFLRHYRHIGVRGASENWDTREAREAGRVVAREIARRNRPLVAEAGGGPGAAPPGQRDATGGRPDAVVCQERSSKFPAGG
jgi:hypothetical protein